MTDPSITVSRNTAKTLLEKLSGLFPRWKHTEEQSDLWRRRFEGLDYSAAYEAIERMRETYSSDDPQIRWFTAAYEKTRPLSTVDRTAANLEEEEHDRQVHRDRAEALAGLMAQYRADPEYVLACRNKIRSGGRHWVPAAEAGADDDDPCPATWSHRMRILVWLLIDKYGGDLDALLGDAIDRPVLSLNQRLREMARRRPQ